MRDDTIGRCHRVLVVLVAVLTVQRRAGLAELIELVKRPFPASHVVVRICGIQRVEPVLVEIEYPRRLEREERDVARREVALVIYRPRLDDVVVPPRLGEVQRAHLQKVGQYPVRHKRAYVVDRAERGVIDVVARGDCRANEL